MGARISGAAAPKDAFVHKGNSIHIDKMEHVACNVSESLHKSGFRHWVEVVDLQLEEICKFKHANAVLDQI